MKAKILAALLLCCVVSGAAEARYHAWHSGLTRIRLADGQPITVASAYANRFLGFLNALLAREGRLPHVGCYSPRGHMRNSLHHWGGACDVGQRARNVAWRPMYHVAALAQEFGLTDGCSWRHPDCGHVDVSGSVHRGRAAFASVRHHLIARPIVRTAAVHQYTNPTIPPPQ